MKLFAVKIGNKIGSFAPIELKAQTLKEMKSLKKLDVNNLQLEKEKVDELKTLQEELKEAVFIIAEITDFTEEKIF